jgi:hypothetical protein
VRLGRIDLDREREAKDLDEDRALRAARVTAAPARLVKGRSRASASNGPAVDHEHRRVGPPTVAQADGRREPSHRLRPHALVAPAPPLAPHGLPVGEPLREVAPLAARPREPQDRIHDLPARNIPLHAPMDGRIEQVLDNLPLVVREFHHCAHEHSLPEGRVRFYGTNGKIRARTIGYRLLDSRLCN